MGTSRTSAEIRKMFITPMSEMIAEMMRLCDEWDSAVEQEDISVGNLHLNEAMACNSMGLIKKFIRELRGKLDDAKAGVYRYRENEWRNPKTDEAASAASAHSGNKGRGRAERPDESSSGSFRDLADDSSSRFRHGSSLKRRNSPDSPGLSDAKKTSKAQNQKRGNGGQPDRKPNQQ